MRATLGALLRAERSKRGRSARWLALAVGANERTIPRVEAGERRPSGMLLRSIASALDPDEPKPLAGRLCAAAGPSLARDTPGKLHHWIRRSEEAILAGHRPLPERLDQAIRLHRAADRAWREAMAILDQPGALDDPDALHASARLMDENRRLRAEAGGAVVLYVGGRRFSFGWAAP